MNSQAAPAAACDCHFHIMDAAAITVVNPQVPNRTASVRDYRKFAETLGLTRGVVVQPSLYGTNNDLTLKALSTLGTAYRAIFVINTDPGRQTLSSWNDAGVRGIRFNLVQAGANTVAMLPEIARLIADFGWHIQLHANSHQLVEIESVLEALPVRVVLDHFARLSLPGALTQPSWKTIVRLLEKDKIWVKLSGPYHISRDNSSNYADAVQLALQIITVAPNRSLWGSDWPHVTEPVTPHVTTLQAFMRDSVGDYLDQVLVQNPAELYGF